MNQPDRQPAGVPTGGQFAPGARARADVTLGAAAEQQSNPLLMQASGKPIRLHTLRTAGGVLHGIDKIDSYFGDNTARCGTLVRADDIDETGKVCNATELTCPDCIAATEQMGQVHNPSSGRTQLGRGAIKGSGMNYGTVGRCLCGWHRQINQAPSKGGQKAMDAAIEAHRNDAAAEAAARREMLAARARSTSTDIDIDHSTGAQ